MSKLWFTSGGNVCLDLQSTPGDKSRFNLKCRPFLFMRFSFGQLSLDSELRGPGLCFPHCISASIPEPEMQQEQQEAFIVKDHFS